jgi:RNA polymerase sigma factor (sigma-70 family)
MRYPIESPSFIVRASQARRAVAHRKPRTQTPRGLSDDDDRVVDVNVELLRDDPALGESVVDRGQLPERGRDAETHFVGATAAAAEPEKSSQKLAILNGRVSKWYDEYDNRIRDVVRDTYRVPKFAVPDVVQEVWLKVWTRLCDGEALLPSTEAEPWPWIEKIVKSMAGEYYRCRASQERRKTVWRAEHQKTDRRWKIRGKWTRFPPKNVSAISDAVKKAAIDAVEALEATDRDVLSDRYWKGLKITEMAHRAGIHRKAAERKVVKALRVVGTNLGELPADVFPEPVILKFPGPRRPKGPDGPAGNRLSAAG